LTINNVTMRPNDVLSVITEHYLSSHDFNGISAEQLAQTFGVAWPTLYDPLHRLISEGKVGALFVETDVNPHIIRIGFEPEETQLVQLATCNQYHTCFYPRPAHLELRKSAMRCAVTSHGLWRSILRQEGVYGFFLRTEQPTKWKCEDVAL